MPKKILVIEDNEQNRILMRQILKYHGYEVLEAADGVAGLEMARAYMPDLILLDLQMPLMGGFAVIEELRKTPELSKLKVIAVTSFAMKGDREKALEAGFDEYVTKPIDTRKFIELVKNILPGESTKKKQVILCVDGAAVVVSSDDLRVALVETVRCRRICRRFVRWPSSMVQPEDRMGVVDVGRHLAGGQRCHVRLVVLCKRATKGDGHRQLHLGCPAHTVEHTHSVGLDIQVSSRFTVHRLAGIVDVVLLVRRGADPPVYCDH